MSKKGLLFIGVLLVGSIFLILANFSPSKKFADGRLQITTSVYPLYFFTGQIVGDKGSVYNITPSGAEPHDYDPTTQDIARVEDSDLLILNGVKLEAWGGKLTDILKDTNTKVIAVSDSVVKNAASDYMQSAQDPHVWLDPTLAAQQIIIITDGLKIADPANASYFENNAKILQTKLASLDEKFRTGLESCQKKDIITAHAAFGYLAKKYGFNQISISGLSPDDEPSVQKLATLADFAKKNNVKYIFFESLVSPKLAETVANEVGATTLVLNPLEGLSDIEIRNGKNYFSEMEKNLFNLRIALECR